MRKERILDDEFSAIELLDVLGGDLANVNGARSSYGKHKAALDEKDSKLLSYLGANAHTAPLRHTYFTLRVKAPEFIARQWYKHVVGAQYAFNDLPWSEYSLRYSEVPDEFYIPKRARVQSHGENKQASEFVTGDQADYLARIYCGKVLGKRSTVMKP